MFAVRRFHWAWPRKREQLRLPPSRNARPQRRVRPESRWAIQDLQSHAPHGHERCPSRSTARLSGTARRAPPALPAAVHCTTHREPSNREPGSTRGSQRPRKPQKTPPRLKTRRCPPLQRAGRSPAAPAAPARPRRKRSPGGQSSPGSQNTRNESSKPSMWRCQPQGPGRRMAPSPRPPKRSPSLGRERTPCRPRPARSSAPESCSLPRTRRSPGRQCSSQNGSACRTAKNPAPSAP